MKAIKLHGAKDLRLEQVDDPAMPQTGEVLIRVRAVGICGSDLHMYESGRIGYTDAVESFILGHEFMGEVLAVGDTALDGNHQPLEIGQRVAVDPATPCWHCEMCEKGHPNLCWNLAFHGLYPDAGALQERMIVSSRNCFPMPDSISDGAGTLLETLGVAIHAIDLSKIKLTDTVAVIGCGPVGLLIIQLVKLVGASKIYAFDKFDWRVEKARELGAEAWNVDSIDAVSKIEDLTHGRGVDVSIEVAWADHSVQMAADMARLGGRLVLVGIPVDDQIRLSHAVARRKGLTIMMVRRMKHSYPRAIDLATSGKVELDSLISHHFSLEETATAFEKNFNYEHGIHKIIVDI